MLEPAKKRQSSVQLRRLSPDFGPPPKGTILAAGQCACCCTCCLQMLTSGSAGLVAAGILGWHWLGLDSRRAKVKTAVLAGFGGLFVGAWAGLGQLTVDSSWGPPWWWTFGFATLALAVMGLGIARWDRRRATTGSFASLRFPPRALMVLSAAVIYAGYIASCFPGKADPMSETLALGFPLIGAVFSIMDQGRGVRRMSFLECYLTALLFGGILAPGLAFPTTAGIEHGTAAFTAGIIVGAGAWAYTAHRRRLPLSMVFGTLEGFIGGFLFMAALGLATEASRPEIYRGVPGAIAGAALSLWLGRDLARRHGRRLILSPLILSPFPGSIGFAVITLLVWEMV